MNRFARRAGLPRGAYAKSLDEVVAPYRTGMSWNMLKHNRCPKCLKDWAYDLTQDRDILVHGCGFAIREKRYAQIVSSQVTQELEDALNKEYGVE